MSHDPAVGRGWEFYIYFCQVQHVQGCHSKLTDRPLLPLTWIVSVKTWGPMLLDMTKLQLYLPASLLSGRTKEAGHIVRLTINANVLREDLRTNIAGNDEPAHVNASIGFIWKQESMQESVRREETEGRNRMVREAKKDNTRHAPPPKQTHTYQTIHTRFCNSKWSRGDEGDAPHVFVFEHLFTI